jgi:hypothetical protein
MTNAPPSRNPSDNDSIPGLFNIILSKFLQSVDDCLPAQIVSYDAETNLAEIQPLISIIDTSKETTTRGPVASVPVMQIGLGGFVLRFPAKAGDLGWIKANDRDISIFKQTFENSDPNTYRKHSFEDAVFIPDTLMNGVTIDPSDINSAVLQSFDGTVRIALAETYIKIIAPGVGIGGQPDAHAILDLQSTTKALIFPRMTAAQRNAIGSPKEGMAVWNLDNHTLSTYNGSTWS